MLCHIVIKVITPLILFHTTFGTYMAFIWIEKSPCISLIWFRYGFSKGQRGCNDIKIVYISNFSQFRSRGGGSSKSIFSQIQKSPKPPRGGGGVKKIMDFYLNLWHLFFDCSPQHETFSHKHYNQMISYCSQLFKSTERFQYVHLNGGIPTPSLHSCRAGRMRFSELKLTKKLHFSRKNWFQN